MDSAWPRETCAQNMHIGQVSTRGGCSKVAALASGRGGGSGSGNASSVVRDGGSAIISLRRLPLRLWRAAQVQRTHGGEGEGGAHHLGVLIDLLDVPERHGYGGWWGLLAARLHDRVLITPMIKEWRSDSEDLDLDLLDLGALRLERQRFEAPL